MTFTAMFLFVLCVASWKDGRPKTYGKGWRSVTPLNTVLVVVVVARPLPGLCSSSSCLDGLNKIN